MPTDNISARKIRGEAGLMWTAPFGKACFSACRRRITIIAAGEEERAPNPLKGPKSNRMGSKSFQKRDYRLLLFFGQTQRPYPRVKVGVRAAAPVIEFDHFFERL